MAKHDIILIDGIIEERVAQAFPSTDKGEVFEYLSAEQILKDYDLSYEQIMDNSVDGQNDGGIDYIFFFINGQLINDPKTFVYPRNNCEFEAYFISCKHADSFKLSPVDSMYASLSELLDFSIKTSNLNGQYNQDIIRKRNDFISIYRNTAFAPNSHLKIHVIYSCRGNTDELGENILARSKQIEHSISQNYSNCYVEFLFWGSAEILSKYRKVRKYDIDLPCEKIMSKGSHAVVLAKLTDYYNFVTDEEGQLRRYLFDANVRDYMGLNRVNQDILTTLSNQESSDFWLLNNGVTILVDYLFPLGETISLQNIQIVNGLQTTLTIFNYFSSGGVDQSNRCILIKIIKSNEPIVRDEIIKATNNQTDVSISALHATDKIQRDIEEIMPTVGLYYERKIKFYENQGIDLDQIVSPLYLASAYVSLVMKLPYAAVVLKQKFMNDQEKYELVFSESVNLRLWPQLALILKKTDRFIKENRGTLKLSEKVNKFLRQPLAFFTVARKIGKYTFSERELMDMDVNSITDSDYNYVWSLLSVELNRGKTIKDVASRAFFLELCGTIPDIKNANAMRRIKSPFIQYKKLELAPDFILQVKNVLPPQPWEVGVHRKIAEQLNSTPNRVYQAIDELIHRGEFYEQIDGVLYDKQGKHIS